MKNFTTEDIKNLVRYLNRRYSDSNIIDKVTERNAFNI